MMVLQLSRLEKFRSRRQPLVEGRDFQDNSGTNENVDSDFGTRSKVSLLDQHSELKKKAEGKISW